MAAQDDVERRAAQADTRARRVLDPPHREALPAALVHDIEQARQALAAAAAEPITIGFVGFFSTGKSLLIGSLLGDPALLPSGQVPVTGNVLAVRPRPVADGHPTRPAPLATIEYFDAAAVADLRGDFRRRLAARAADYGDPGPAGAEWSQLAEWCATTGVQFDIGPLIAEFDRLHAAVRRFPHLIGPHAHTVAVPWEVVRSSVLLLPDVERPPVADPRRFAGLTVAELTDTAPLIHRVHLDVEVPRRCWPVDPAVAGDEIVLLDFPGRSASRSAARDEFLRARASTTINALMILLDPTKPGEGSAEEILRTFVSNDWSPTARAGLDGAPPGAGEHSRRHAVLAGISRFDLLPDAAPDPGQRSLPVTALPASLRTLWGTAQAVLPRGGGHRAVIVSAITHWATTSGAATGASGPAPVPLGDEHATSDDLRAAVLDKAQRWAAVADALPPDAPIRPALAEYARDGGMGRLRHVVTEHARDRGLAQKLHRVTTLATALDRHLERAWEHIGVQRAAAPAAVPEKQRLRDAIRATRDALTRTEETVKRQLQDPSFPLPDGRSAQDAVERFAVDRVYSWSEWRALLGAVENGEVRVRRGREIPVETTAFVAPFDRTVREVRERAAEVAQRATATWLTRRHHELAPQAERLLAELRPVKDLLTAAPGMDAHLSALLRAVGNAWLLDLQPPAAIEPLGERERARLFPLRASRALPWHPARLGRTTRDDRHPIHVARLRREVARAVVRLGVEALVAELTRRLELIVTELGAVTVDFPTGDALDALLDTAFPPPTVAVSPAVAAEDPLPGPERITDLQL